MAGRFERVSRIAIGTFLAACSVTLWLQHHQSDAEQPFLVAATLLSAGGALLFATGAQRPLTVATLTLAAVASIRIAPLGPPSGLLLASAGVMWACALEFRPRPALMAIGAESALILTVAAVTFPPELYLSAVDATVMNGLIAVCAVLGLRVFLPNVISVDEKRRTTQRDAAEASLDAEDRKLRTRARQLLHDSVIACLMSIADHGRVDTDALRYTCARLSESLAIQQPHLHDAPLPDLLRQHVQMYGEDIEVHCPAEDRWPLLTELSRATLSRALGEVVRNMSRHGTPGSGKITVKRRSEHLSIIARNAVNGGSPPSGGRGWGWENSILAPINAIGGSAHLERRDGHAVTTLVIPTGTHRQPRSTNTFERTVRAINTQSSSIAKLLWVALAANTYVALRNIDPSEHGWQQYIIAATLSAITALGLRIYGRGLTPPLAAQVAVSVGIGLLCLISVVAAGPGALSDLGSWAVGMGAVPLFAMMLFAPPRTAVILWAPLPGAVAVAVSMDSTMTMAGAAGAFIAASSPWAGWLFGALLRKTHTDYLRHVAAQTRTIADVYAARAATAIENDYWGRTRRVVLPLFDAIIAGSIDPADEQVRKRSRLLALQVRDDLYAAGVFDTALQARITDARSRAVRVVIRPPESPRPGDSAALLRLLDRAIDVAEEGNTIIVTLPQQDGSSGSITLVPQPSQRDLAAILRSVDGIDWDRQDDEFATTITLPHGSSRPVIRPARDRVPAPPQPRSSRLRAMSQSHPT